MRLDVGRTGMTFARLLLAAAAVAAVLSPGASMADSTVGSCNPTSVKYIASGPTAFRTTSTSYVDLPQASIAFRQGGTKPSCVLVRFSAAPNANRNMGVRALLGGFPDALPDEMQISDGGDQGPNARRFTFIF